MGRGKFEKQPASKVREDRKTELWQKVLICALIVILVLLIAGAIAVNYVLGRFGSTNDLSGTVPTDDYYETESVEGAESMETLTDDELIFETVELLDGEDVVHILLIGQDARPGETRSRSDTMIVVTLNTTKNAIQLTSFMRDTYVQIPGWANNKLNTPFRFEGAELLDETIKLNFGLEIDGNVVVNFDDFQTIIDLLGGVDIELNSEEVSYMVKKGCSCSEGENHLDGKGALIYCRMRKVTGGDYGRTERQRKVLAALIESVSDQGWSGVQTLIAEVLPYVYTDLDNDQILRYAAAGLSMILDGAEIQTLRLPADDSHTSAMINGMSCLVPDLAACREDLQEFIYGTEE